MFISRPKPEVRKNFLRYRRRLLWHYVNKMIDVSRSLNGFKVSKRKSKADFLFKKEVAIVTVKSKDLKSF